MDEEELYCFSCGHYGQYILLSVNKGLLTQWYLRFARDREMNAGPVVRYNGELNLEMPEVFDKEKIYLYERTGEKFSKPKVVE